MPKTRPFLRLQKVMADAGVASRRKCEEIILEGRVRVNDETVTVLGTKVDPFYDMVEVDGELIDKDAIDKIYMVLNKPRGYVTTVYDPEGRKTVMDLCSPIKQRLFPVGRLDYLSEGLLIMTNDGDLANKIMHPRYGVTKVYEVKVFGLLSEIILNKLRAGVRVDGDLLKPDSVRVIKTLPKKTWLEFRLTEGKNREIRKLCEEVGLTIDKLKRVAIENLSITGIQPGNYAFYTKKELLVKLQMNASGEKIVSDHKYKSPKKSVNPSKLAKRRKYYADSKDADSEAFTRYRKDLYYDTLKKQRETKEKILLEEQAKLEQEQSTN